MKILITGGAGYIGSHMNLKLEATNHQVCIVDNLYSGSIQAIKNSKFYHCDIRNTEELSNIFETEQFDAVMHFASHIEVEESINQPAKYYNNNITGTLSLLDCMVKHRVKNIIFSSTAAVYGAPEYSPINEEHPVKPINPYGQSKAMIEQILADYHEAYDLNFMCLRYFNVSGTDCHKEVVVPRRPITHLIPLVLQAASGRRESIAIFGSNYDTADGTCIRDFIHVNDLCDAHLLALEHLLQGGDSECLNLGNGKGFSVLEIIEAARKVTDKTIEVKHCERRSGDPAEVVANAERAQSLLAWQPKRNAIEQIISDAWQWELVLSKHR